MDKLPQEHNTPTGPSKSVPENQTSTGPKLDGVDETGLPRVERGTLAPRGKRKTDVDAPLPRSSC